MRLGDDKISPIDVRIISATNRDLFQQTQTGSFRQDLYYRINVIELDVPSLRQRQDDIAELSEEILLRIAEDNYVSPVPTLSPEALQALCEYPFPGNIRELENILQRAVTLCENGVVSVQNLDLQNGSALPSVTTSPRVLYSPMYNTEAAFSLPHGEGFSLENHLEAIERKAIERALEESRWNKTAAAQRLGMSFRSLRYRMKKLNME